MFGSVTRWGVSVPVVFLTDAQAATYGCYARPPSVAGLDRTGDGPKALFDGAVVWLREHPVLLPGVSTLARLVARVRDAAMQRLWDTLAAPLTAAQAHTLEQLLEIPDGARTSDLERLRRGPTRVSGRAMAAALDRVSELTAIAVGQVEIGAVPRRRVIELARYGMAGKAPALRRHPHARRLATLLATVVVLQARATDDAVELFDVLMTTELLARAQRQTRDEQARRYPRVSKDAGKLAAAVGVLLEATTWGPEITLELVWDAIEAVVSRAELRTAVANITDIVPTPGTDPDAEWRATLVDRFAVVRPFLPMLCTAIAFGATAEATPVSLTRCAPSRTCSMPAPSGRVPAGYLDARKVAVDLVPPGWARVVFTPGRPEATVNRAGYVFCVLELFHQRATPPRHLRARLHPVGRPAVAAAGGLGVGGRKRPGAQRAAAPARSRPAVGRARPRPRRRAAPRRRPPDRQHRGLHR
jgi:hypothetical protein